MYCYDSLINIIDFFLFWNVSSSGCSSISFLVHLPSLCIFHTSLCYYFRTSTDYLTTMSGKLGRPGGRAPQLSNLWGLPPRYCGFLTKLSAYVTTVFSYVDKFRYEFCNDNQFLNMHFSLIWENMNPRIVSLFAVDQTRQ